MQHYTLFTQATPATSRSLARAAVSILGEYIEDPEVLEEFDLILTEACANVVRHAYQRQTDRPEYDEAMQDTTSDNGLEITLGIVPDRHVQMTISDWGAAPDIDIENIEPPVATAEGGRGLYIIKSLTHALDFTRQGNKHTLTCTKQVGEHAWKTSRTP